MIPKITSFRNVMAMVLVVEIPALAILKGLGMLPDLPSDMLLVFVSQFPLIVYFFFRSDDNPTKVP